MMHPAEDTASDLHLGVWGDKMLVLANSAAADCVLRFDWPFGEAMLSDFGGFLAFFWFLEPLLDRETPLPGVSLSEGGLWDPQVEGVELGGSSSGIRLRLPSASVNRDMSSGW